MRRWLLHHDAARGRQRQNANTKLIADLAAGKAPDIDLAAGKAPEIYLQRNRTSPCRRSGRGSSPAWMATGRWTSDVASSLGGDVHGADSCFLFYGSDLFVAGGAGSGRLLDGPGRGPGRGPDRAWTRPGRGTATTGLLSGKQSCGRRSLRLSRARGAKC